MRRSLVRKLTGSTKALIKGTRFVLLKNPWNLTPKQKRVLSSLVRSNHPLTRAWSLKEDFQRFWDYLHETWAWRHLDQWLWWTSHSRLEPFKDFARMIRKPKAGILAWTRLRVSNGALEGLNNKVKLVSHRVLASDSLRPRISRVCGDAIPRRSKKRSSQRPPTVNRTCQRGHPTTPNTLKNTLLAPLVMRTQGLTKRADGPSRTRTAFANKL